MEALAPEIMKVTSARSMLDTEFTAEQPYSKYTGMVFKTTNKIIDTTVVFNQRGYYEELVSKIYAGERLDEMRMNLGSNAYELSKQFESDELEVIAFTWRYRDSQTQEYINSDFKFIGFVILACFAYMIFHTYSVALSFISLLNVFMSIPVSLVIYKHIFGIEYFSSLHLSIIIIVIGIGSDDIFVFHDFWKNNFELIALK